MPLFLDKTQARPIFDRLNNSGYVQDLDGFFQHHLRVSNISFCLAMASKDKQYQINPALLRAQGLVHDIAGLWLKNQLGHELGVARWIIESGEQNGLVFGGTKNERELALREMAKCTLRDSPLYEHFELEHLNKGEYDFELKYLSTELLGTNYTKGDDRILKDLLLPEDLPIGIHQFISLVADMSDGGQGKIITMEERFEDLISRYSNPQHPHYNPKEHKVIEKVKPRFILARDRLQESLNMSIEDAFKRYNTLV